MVKTIMERCGITEGQYRVENEWLAWDYTDKGDEQCAQFYHAAKELGYLE